MKGGVWEGWGGVGRWHGGIFNNNEYELESC